MKIANELLSQFPLFFQDNFLLLLINNIFIK